MQLPSVHDLAAPLLGALLTMFSGAALRYLREIRNSVTIYKQEHDILWEDYNKRYDLPWRRGMDRVRNGISRRMKVKVT